MPLASHNLNDTIVALATPPGVGAIGVIRLSGPDAISIADAVFVGKKLANQPSHTVHFGTIQSSLSPALSKGEEATLSPSTELRGEENFIIDEVLATVFKAPKSYTKENVVEISTHGSPYIQQQIIQLLIKKGARLAQPGEFTLRAFLNGKIDLSQAEAVADLIAASSEAAHTVAMRQMRGGFSNEIKKLRSDLIQFASLIELELDFSDEDVEFANRQDLKALVQKIQTLIRALIQSFTLGNVIKNGVITVIAGRPNAGKSTLLNALLNEDRAIVSEIAGTTRDTIEEVLNINGVQFRLIDTAGIREATDQIEAIGVAKTLEKVRQAALLVYVFDVTQTTLLEVHQDLSQLQGDNIRLLVVCNKMDLNPYFRPEWLINPLDETIPDIFVAPHPLSNSERLMVSNLTGLTDDQIITLSAKNRQNIDWLKTCLLNAVVEGGLTPESTIVSNARHFEALQKAQNSLDAVLVGLETGVTSDFIAMDIRRALFHLGEITGEVGVEDLLEHIFSKFCIGK